MSEAPMDYRIKNPWWVIAPLLSMVAFTFMLLVPWMRRVELQDPTLAWLCFINAAVWWIVLWWSLHHLGFKVSPLFIRPRQRTAAAPASPVRFAILYPTCDDFDWAACKSCVEQDYDPDYHRVIICDDSSSAESRQRVDEFASLFPALGVVRRPDRRGYKAGNLNHAIAGLSPADADWLVIVDADQHLPQDYLQRLSASVAEMPETVAFVQARQASDHLLPLRSATRFQHALGHEIDIFYGYDLAWRTSSGFLPLVGHGAALRRSAWDRVRFPEIVSEDFAISMELRNQSLIGVYADSVESWESFPESFGAFLIRLRKFSGGTAELYRHCMKSFLLGPATFTEKLDLAMMVGWYGLMPLVIANGYLSAYVCHRLWMQRVSALHPALPYLFVVMFLLNTPVLYSAAPTFLHAVQHWFWSSAIYGACLPIASARFLVHLIGARARFDRTPKGGEAAPIGRGTCSAMILLGLATLGISACWYSPFSPVLVGLGVSYLSVPLYTQLNESTVPGAIARLAIFLPGAFYICALWEMWWWQGI